MKCPKETCEGCADFYYGFQHCKYEVRKLCPRCLVNPLAENDALNAISHDGKTIICSQCGQIESLEKLDPARAYGLKVGLRRAQAALYGLDENRNPKTQMNEEIMNETCTCVVLLKTCKSCGFTFGWLAKSPGCSKHKEQPLECPKCGSKEMLE